MTLNSSQIVLRMPAPRLFTHGVQDDSDPARGAAQRLKDGPGHAARLLIVEDDWFIGQEIEAAALAANYAVVGIATSAEAAVQAALDQVPDLVLMDIRLAGTRDGVEAALEIRERADIPCLFVSAHRDEEVRGRAQAARPAGWLSKPFSDSQLLSAIRQALRADGPAT
ncbi:MAG: response regulator [Tistlia sp.]|uniref:response regulator n=1 Tax=Tistlia sp. TaxID=3057121 RepID=UPI0034A0D5B1